MNTLSEFEARIKEIVVDALHLEDVTPTEIQSEEPLFGEGLGLDSIDALELASALEREFGIRISASKGDMKAVFHSVRSLATFVMQARKDAEAR